MGVYSGLLHRDCFIGINDITTEGVYVWADGSDSTYRNWNKGEPNDHSGDEECGEIDNDGVWNDIRCYKNLTCYFCSVKVNNCTYLQFIDFPGIARIECQTRHQLYHLF